MQSPSSHLHRTTSDLQDWFARFRKHIIGIDQTFDTPFGKKPLVYADWTASGRLYGPIETRLQRHIMPFVGNTHTETSTTGSAMTHAYHEALHLIKQHVGGNEHDVILARGAGMTSIINKFQRILGLRLHEHFRERIHLSEAERPIVFVTHMEHHSNQISWLETIADLEVIRPTPQGEVDLNHLEDLLHRYQKRKLKIGAFTSCSNVTGIFTPYHQLAALMHRYGGLCFVDFACSAPYIPIQMHPEKEEERLDAIYFSPHKFLGGPGTPGIIVFHESLYQNEVPDVPGGGTVAWTNPWGGRRYFDDIQLREDGGTPAFLQTIKAGLAFQLKQEMDPQRMLAREEELLDIIWPAMHRIPGLHLLADEHRRRLGVLSFYIEGLHYNLAVRLLNDRYGIQTRGGCSCAGTYGHYLLQISYEKSKAITDQIDHGHLEAKPGWVRLSIHPTMTDEEAHYIVGALEELAKNHRKWAEDYTYDKRTNEFYHKDGRTRERDMAMRWLHQPLTPPA